LYGYNASKIRLTMRDNMSNKSMTICDNASEVQRIGSIETD